MEILGWVANSLFFAGSAFKNPRWTIAAYALGECFFIALYLLMDLYVAAIAMGLTALRAVLSLFLSTKHNMASTVIITSLSCFIILSQISSIADGLILFAALAIGMSYLYRDNFVPFRVLTIISVLLWAIHSAMFEVNSMLFCCLIMLATNIASFIAYTGTKDMILQRLAVLKNG